MRWPRGAAPRPVGVVAEPTPGPGRAGAYTSGIALLSILSLVCVLGIFWGELTNHRLLAGALIGIVLLAYSFILLFLRKGGFTGV